MTFHHYMGWGAIAALAHRRSHPVALALGVLAILDAAKLYAHPVAPWVRLDAALWMLWPLPAATLAAWAWRSRPKLVAAAFALYAATVLLPRWSWATHPRAWTVALWAPHVAGLLVAGVAWWRWKDEGPGGLRLPPGPALSPLSRSDAFTRLPVPDDGLSAIPAAKPMCTRVVSAMDPRPRHVDPTPSRTLAQQVAGILALSSAVDLLVGAGAPGVGYEYAAPLAWAAWAAIGWVLVRRREE